MFKPVNNCLIVSRLPAEDKTPDGILLPESSRPDIFDCLVHAVGPGKLLDDGRTRHPMQARKGDRVILERRCFHEISPEGSRTIIGMCRDEELCAVLHGPDHEDVSPAGEHVLLRLEQQTEVDPESGATIEKRQGAVLQVRGSSIGGSARTRIEAEQALRDLRTLEKSPAFAEQPSEFYQHRMIHRYMDSLLPDVREELGRLLHNAQDRMTKTTAPVYYREPARCGEVVATGPGKAHEDGTRNGMPALLPGQRVWLDRGYRGLRVGSRYLLAPVGHLAAVEV